MEWQSEDFGELAVPLKQWKYGQTNQSQSSQNSQLSKGLEEMKIIYPSENTEFW